MRSVNKLILGLLLLYKPFFCQISRAVFYNDKLKRDVVTRYRDYALVFDSPLLSEEKIYLNIKSDSLDNGFMTFYIYVYFPKRINPKDLNLLIGYKDGTTDIFHQNRFDSDDNYAEYTAIDDINNISSKEVKYILFRGIKKFQCYDKRYFIDFLKKIP